MLPIQSWKDSFHTGYNLEAIHSYQIKANDNSFDANINLGFKYYINHFFTKDGVPKYYNDKMYPIDIHCPAQLFVTLQKLNKYKQNDELAKKVINWTIDNMQDNQGFFYYQLKPYMNSKISYMRWSNAFMFNAISYYLLRENN